MPNTIGSPLNFAGGSTNSSSVGVGGPESDDGDVGQGNKESGRGRNGRHVQRGKNWNEEDSIRLVQAYTWVESVKKRTTISKRCHSNLSIRVQGKRRPKDV
jgi:hypothetical protein